MDPRTGVIPGDGTMSDSADEDSDYEEFTKKVLTSFSVPPSSTPIQSQMNTQRLILILNFLSCFSDLLLSSTYELN